LLRTGVAVVARLQAERERRRGLQVPSGVIKASANIVGEAESVQSIAIRYPVSDVASPAARGIASLLWTKESAIYRHAALFHYV
jgi:hypothetical protein